MKPAIPQVNETEAAEFLNCRPQTLRGWRHRKTGPPYLKVAGKISYRVPDLEQYVEDSRVVPGETRRRRKAS